MSVECKKTKMKILLANNGLSALKFTISAKKSSRVKVYIIGLATAEDIANNAHYIQHVDGIHEIMSEQEYNDVNQIVNIAKKYSCDAVYPGWGKTGSKGSCRRHISKNRHADRLGAALRGTSRVAHVECSI